MTPECYKVGLASTIGIMGRGAKNSGSPEQNELYTRAVAECGRMLDRLPAGYEADPDKRRDLRQEIHLQLWRSFGAFDGRCSLKTWTLRVAHNTAASYVVRERRMNAKLISLEEIERTLESVEQPRDIDREMALREVQQVILKLRPLDRQIIISYLEGIGCRFHRGHHGSNSCKHRHEDSSDQEDTRTPDSRGAVACVSFLNLRK